MAKKLWTPKVIAIDRFQCTVDPHLFGLLVFSYADHPDWVMTRVFCWKCAFHHRVLDNLNVALYKNAWASNFSAI